MHITIIQAVLLAILQGITELFPISSLGNSILLPHLVGVSINTKSTAFLPLLTMLHLGTATALLVYFRNDWVAISKGAIKGTALRRLFLLLVIGTIPAGIIGLLLEKKLSLLFGSYRVVALFLFLNGFVLLLGERLRKKAGSKQVEHLSYKNAFSIGVSQTVALLPGFSRSGASLVGGLFVGLTHEAAARFSFLLATPIILAAGVLEVPKLLKGNERPELIPALIGGIVAGITAYGTTIFLMKYFKDHEKNALFPFAIYCFILATIALLVH